MKKVWIYALADPNTEQIRYVGKANNPEQRLARHLCHAKSGTCHRDRWIQKLWESGQNPVLILLHRATASNWQKLERKWIKHFRNQDSLTNVTDGGDGVIGYIFTEKVKQRISVSLKKRFADHPESNPMFGRCHTEEAKQKISLANLGKHHSEEAKQKIAIARLGNCLSEKTKQKISVSQRGKYISEETKRKMSLSQKKRLANPESHPMFGKHHTEESKQKIALACLGRHLSEETKRKCSSGVFPQC